MYCKYLFFGEAIARAEEADNACIGRRGPVNMLQELPETFTLGDLDRLRAQRGKPTGGRHAIKQVQKWKERNLVMPGLQSGTFVKVPSGDRRQ
ncbi:MAG TPA: hypothetical protein H9824_03510 [Candidatus Bacteroides pullicola]|uniref:Uncharacterized protein n=1 Tax=Candidatus Bacteroides pullicola TaxID=2838475 RepID=A0A9D2CKA0_9BACE|nr:hypothetical protein [Candidatus Bacteroides pullicola]